MIPFSCDSSPKVAFIRHSGFSDSNLPRVCLEKREMNVELHNVYQWLVFNKLTHKAIPIKCFVSHRPVSCDGGSVGRAKKKKKKKKGE